MSDEIKTDLNEARELASNLDYYDDYGGSAPGEAADMLRDMANEIERLRYIFPEDKEIDQVANDEAQQDWNILRFKTVYIEGFTEGAKWVRSKIKTN